GAGEIAAKRRSKIIDGTGVTEHTANARAVSSDHAPRLGFGKERPGCEGLGDECIDAIDGKITARKARGRGPSRPRSQYQGKRSERGFGEPAEGRDLAANHGEERSLATRAVEGEHIVARRVLRIARAVVVERTHARKRPDHVRRRHAGTEVIVDHAAKIAD